MGGRPPAITAVQQEVVCFRENNGFWKEAKTTTMRTPTDEGCPDSTQPRNTKNGGTNGWRPSDSPQTCVWSVANSKSTLGVHVADRDSVRWSGQERGRRGCRPRPRLPAGLLQAVTRPPAVPVHSAFSVPSGVTPAATQQHPGHEDHRGRDQWQPGTVSAVGLTDAACAQRDPEGPRQLPAVCTCQGRRLQKTDSRTACTFRGRVLPQEGAAPWGQCMTAQP